MPNIRLIGTGLLSCALLSIASPLFATPSVVPDASVKIVNGAKAPLRWIGVGDLHSTTQLCVASNTGRYRLQLALVQDAADAHAPAYEIEFRTAAGDSEFRRSGTGNIYVFDGRTSETEDCNGTTNASLKIRFSRDNLTAAVAGEYAEQFQISVIPN
ncbi:hypothetical protein [Sphingorhabdus sp. 109]|jgi:hypothetical protein|uniref:hypothetical protein n=1 Tax=Sphingorhabdus sp. 109 TaxID=2653173 RepID=UPI0012EEEAC8|nr:hypothetical protein [Sphingorhabdus sp. 109]VWX60614.1 conserved exported hypothetical protein [Sphingorhabdus sp. 109]